MLYKPMQPSKEDQIRNLESHLERLCKQIEETTTEIEQMELLEDYTIAQEEHIKLTGKYYEPNDC